MTAAGPGRFAIPLVRPIAPISAAVVAGDMVYLSGCVALDARSGEVVGTTVGMQVREVFGQMEETLRRVGADLTDVVRCVCYLTDAAGMAALNDAFREVFGADPPARTTVVAGLAVPGLLVEIEATAYRPAGGAE